jgi:DNA-binding transcriptional MocR family regulator
MDTSASYVGSAPSSPSRVSVVIETLRARIQSRALGRGARLPSVRRLAEELGVSKSTVVEAYDRLAAEGAVEARRGSGFFVASAPEPLVLARAPSLDPAVDLLAIVRRELQARPDVLQPASGWLPESWLPAAGFEKALRYVARSGGPARLRYDSPLGFEPLRKLIAARMVERGVRVDPAQIVLTDSTTQALDLAARLFLSSGDRIVIDDPRYYNLIQLVDAHRAEIIAVPYTSEGPDVAALEAIFAEHRPRLYFMISGPHNPTGACLSPTVAHRVLTLAERYDVTIVEDDIYGDFESTPSARVATFDGFDRVVSVGGFSKTVSTGLRIGYLIARPDWIEPIVDLKLATTLGNSAFAAAVFHNFLTEGGYRRHLDTLRPRLAEAIARTCVRLRACGATPWIEPQSGMFVWAKLPDDLDATDVARAAQDDNVVFAPGRSFSASLEWRGYMRFNVAACADPHVFEVLGRAMEKARSTRAQAERPENSFA